MTILLPEDYHARRWLESHRISCITREEGLKQDIRALRIGLLNLTPESPDPALRLLQPMGRSILHLEPHSILIGDKAPHELCPYSGHFEELNRHKPLDGILVTGVIDRKNAYSSGDSIAHWNEVNQILSEARRTIVSTIGIGLGGIAISHHLGIASREIDPPLDAIYRSYGINRSHPITGDFDDEFDCPQRRLFHIDESTLRYHEQRGRLSLLADSDQGGFFIFGTPDYRLIAHLGDPAALPEEYNHTFNSWQSHRDELITSWIKFLYLANDY